MFVVQNYGKPCRTVKVYYKSIKREEIAVTYQRKSFIPEDEATGSR